MSEKNEFEYEDEELEGFDYEDNQTPIEDIPLKDMTEDQLKIWLDFKPV